MTVDDAITHCTTITKQHSSTFFMGSCLFSGQERQAVRVVYAVCRLGDDAVDEALNVHDAEQRLRVWWQHIERAYAGEVASHEPLEVALRWVLDRFDIPKYAFEELYLGFESDLYLARMETLEDLMLYARRVAGVVGLMITPIAGYRGGSATLVDALALGQAMQITNILRDVGEDLSMGRCYLPRDLLEKYNVDLQQVQQTGVTKDYVALMEELAQLAHKLYRLGWQSIPKLNGVSATAVGVAALNYEGILHKLKQNQYDNLTKRAFLRPYERMALIPRAVAGVMTGMYA